MKTDINGILLLLLVILSAACNNTKKSSVPKIAQVAQSDDLWTGVAISDDDRLFVNYPKWSPGAGISVAEIVEGEKVPYPSEKINTRIPDSSTIHRFSCVQSLFADHAGSLWVLDPANPYFNGVEKTGPRLYRIDLKRDSIIRIYTFDQDMYKSRSYFNDVRIDLEKNKAYITDSGNGALIVLDLESGNARRLLDEHHSTSAQTSYLVINKDTMSIEVDSDGIALSNDGKDLYYAVLSGHTLYKVPAAALLDTTLDREELESSVSSVSEIAATDGMLFNKFGTLFLGGLENNSVYTYHPEGGYSRLLSHPEVKWADSFAMDAEGSVYFTTSQLHLPSDKRGKFKIYKIVYN